MKQKITILCIFVFLGISLTLLTSCAFKQTGTEEGYVMLNGDTVYFIMNKKFDTKTELQNYMEQQMNGEFPANTVLSFDDKSSYKQLKSGYKIKVWSSEILTTYPERMIVKKFEIVEKNDMEKR
ncbi:DUF3221 domain-containing protein [Bacillus sp. C1]